MSFYIRNLINFMSLIIHSHNFSIIYMFLCHNNFNFMSFSHWKFDKFYVITILILCHILIYNDLQNN